MDYSYTLKIYIIVGYLALAIALFACPKQVIVAILFGAYSNSYSLDSAVILPPMQKTYT